MRNRVILISLCILLFTAIGAAPRYLEELRIGGGYNDPVNGGADFESDGDILTTGTLSVDGTTALQDDLYVNGKVRTTELALTNSGYPSIGFNAYYSSGWKFKNAGYAWLSIANNSSGTLTYQQSNASGSADGSVTFANRLTLDNSKATFAGDALFDGGDIGVTGDTSLITLSAGAVGVDADLTITTGMFAMDNEVTITADDTSPSVSGTNVLIVPTSGWTTSGVNALDDGVDGQIVTFICPSTPDTDFEVLNETGGGANIHMNNGDWSGPLADDSTLTLICYSGQWYELGRS